MVERCSSSRCKLARLGGNLSMTPASSGSKCISSSSRLPLGAGRRFHRKCRRFSTTAPVCSSSGDNSTSSTTVVRRSLVDVMYCCSNRAATLSSFWPSSPPVWLSTCWRTLSKRSRRLDRSPRIANTPGGDACHVRHDLQPSLCQHGCRGCVQLSQPIRHSRLDRLALVGPVEVPAIYPRPFEGMRIHPIPRLRHLVQHLADDHQRGCVFRIEGYYPLVVQRCHTLCLHAPIPNFLTACDKYTAIAGKLSSSGEGIVYR
jgi:hypothetical protein